MKIKNDALHVTVPPEAPDVQEDSSLERLLFCEALLEEYKGLEDQPTLDPQGLTDIETTIRNFRKGRYREMDESLRQEAETAFEGEMLQRIYNLINKAQSTKATDMRARLTDKYKDVADAQERANVVDCAFVAEVLGEEEDLRQQFLEETRETQDEEERKLIVERKIRETMKDRGRVTNGSSARPYCWTGVKSEAPQSNGHGNGTGAYENPITPRDAKRLAGCATRSALCLSGGGVRSATFNLGILQGLARHGLLEQFDYLSTVSGGGFIGGWLSAWIRRSGLSEVVKALRTPPRNALNPDPGPVEHLRIYSNYLSPQPGLLSADTWTLIASVTRNLVLNWLVFVPVLLAILLLPRMWTAIVLRSSHYPNLAILLSLFIGFLAGTWALAYIGRSLPSSNDYFLANPTAARYKGGQGPFISRCLIWMLVSAMAIAVCLKNCYSPANASFSWLYFAVFTGAIMLIPWMLCTLRIVEMKPEEKLNRRFLLTMILATSVILGAQIAIGYIASAVVTLALPLLQKYHVAYSIFSVPFILVLMALEGLILTGFTSRFAKDDDQEWWARCGAWVLIIAVAWAFVHLLVLHGPIFILSLEGTFRKLWTGNTQLTWTDLGKLVGTLTGIVSGVVTLLGGFSAKTPANSKEAQKAGMGGLVLAVATQLLAPIFAGFLIILLALGTNWLLTSRPSQGISKAIAGALPYASSPLSAWHISLIKDTPFRLLVIVAILITILGIVMGRLISTNVFSLQYLWRNRIIRAYLGASHLKRRPDSFTGFDSFDNLQMHELWPQPGQDYCSQREDRPKADLKPQRSSRKLFHILNMALNLTGGEKLQWQDRKAESFTVSPFHAGSYWLGYRRSTHYGGTDGITLGASIAISGAFVSPNMGFMMTSPIVRFLMAIFNIRFGWWLGNPGPAGDNTNVFERLLYAPAKMLGFPVKRPFRLDSPRLSVIPFLAEAFGNTDDKSAYVYLSDGGHFENLGLYEMVLRRCRFIVVSDATTDPDYAFESLAMSIRQIRVDLGVPIDIPELAVGVPSQNLKSKYCAIGKIRYSCVDRDPKDKTTPDEDFDGVLIFIKASLIGQEPRDVINYWQSRSSFPQEVITDQWFSEAQFESYRALGSYIIEAICGHKPRALTLPAFELKAREHNRLNFNAFQEQISLLALEQEFKEGMLQTPIPSYRTKVRKFMDSLLR